MNEPAKSHVMAILSARPLLVAAVIVPITIFVMAAVFDYRAERNLVRNQIMATSTALAEHAQTVVETADLVLARVLDRTEGTGWDEIRTSPALHEFLLQSKDGLPQIESVFMVAPDGGNVASTRAFPIDPVPSVADRDYFQRAKAGDTSIFISAAFKGRIDGTSAFTTTRPRLRNGRFDGLAGVTVSPGYFRDFYAQAMDYPGQSTATLVRADGTILFRYPQGPSGLTRLPLDSEFMRATAADGLRGVFEGRSTIDGRLRMGAYRRLRNQPLFAAYSVNSSAYLNSWRTNLVFIGGFSLMLAAALLLTERILIRRTEADKRASQALLAEIERRREAELALEQMQKMEALGRLTGGVAHDFNNLLTAILGPLELAAKRTTDPRILRLLSGAAQAAQRGARLTTQMLAVARKREAVATLLDPNAVIRDVGDLIARTIGPMIELSYELDPQAMPVSADSLQLEMTLVNLCVNARDAMPQGGRLVLRTGCTWLPAPRTGAAGLPAGEYIEISVTDTGEGMTEAVQARALEPFFTTKEPGKGTGLGLSAAYGFAHAAGGAIGITSAPGQGTTVTLTLPRAEGVAAARPVLDVAPPGRVFHILLVDDDRAVRSATRELLDDAGHSVVEAANGPEALDRLRSGEAFDLMVTDFAMPGMDGAQLAAAARTVVPTLPILFVTGYAKGDGLAVWESNGARTLEKPFTGAALGRAIQETMSPRPQRAA